LVQFVNRSQCSFRQALAAGRRRPIRNGRGGVLGNWWSVVVMLSSIFLLLTFIVKRPVSKNSPRPSDAACLRGFARRRQNAFCLSRAYPRRKAAWRSSTGHCLDTIGSLAQNPTDTNMTTNPDGFCTIDDALAELRAGRMVILVDDEYRENEG